MPQARAGYDATLLTLQELPHARLVRKPLDRPSAFAEFANTENATPPGVFGAVHPTWNVVVPPAPVRGVDCVTP